MSNCDIIIKTEDVLQTLLLTEDSLQLVVSSEMGPKGDPGISGGSTLQVTAFDSISSLRAVYIRSSGTCSHASSNSLQGSNVLGISTTSASAGLLFTVQPSGELTDPSWTWIPGLPIYLSTLGNLTQSVPTQGSYQAEVALAKTATSIIVRIYPPILLI